MHRLDYWAVAILGACITFLGLYYGGFINPPCPLSP